MKKYRITAILLLLIGILISYFVYNTEINSESNYNFKYGLDLSGGVHLTYRADTTEIPENEISNSMNALKNVIEKRVNLFKVSEPIIQVEEGGSFSDELDKNRLIVELPGLTDLNQAIEMIGKTPILEFKLAKNDLESLSVVNSLGEDATSEEILAAVNNIYEPTGLTGADLKQASLIFAPNTGEPVVSLQFNPEGSELLRTITSENIGTVMAIFLDGNIISSPVIRGEILSGQAQISGGFQAEEARQLVQDLNLGALPVPIELIETQNIGASLGQETLNKGVLALIIGFAAVSVFLIVWYRVSGLIATISLIFYFLIMLSLFKLIPVVLTASGIAGFILSLGMAVDANVLIFERMKEEFKKGSSSYDAIKDGVSRAWLSIRDGNLSSLISAGVLYWLSGSSVVQGFALVFALGIMASMISSLGVSRVLLLAISSKKPSLIREKLFTSFTKNK